MKNIEDEYRAICGGSWDLSSANCRASSRWGTPDLRNDDLGFRVVHRRRKSMKNIDNEVRAFRGGSWLNGSGYCRASDRFRLTPDPRNVVLGFRVVHRRKA